jgi:hypothetical protein
MELFNTVELVVKNPQTAWVGYSLIILTLIAITLGTMSGFALKVVTNLKELIKLLQNKETSSDYVKQIKNENNIAPLLNDIRIETGADRVVILQYHNGIHSIANNSLLKLSMTHERISMYTSSIMNVVQNWPANYLSSINDEIFNRLCVKYPSIEDMCNTPGLRGAYEQFKDFGIKSMYCFPIADSKGRIFGIGMVQYTGGKYELNDEAMKLVRSLFISIGTLLAGVVEQNMDSQNN